MQETKEMITAKVAEAIRERDRPRPNKSTINEMWNQLGEIKVRCPRCGKVQISRTVASKKCIGCSTTFEVVPNNEPSRTVWCPPGKLRLLHQIVSLTKDGKYLI